MPAKKTVWVEIKDKDVRLVFRCKACEIMEEVAPATNPPICSHCSRQMTYAHTEINTSRNRHESKNATPKWAKRTAWDNVKEGQFFRFNFNSRVFKKVGDAEYRNENNELYVERPTEVYVVQKPASWSNR